LYCKRNSPENTPFKMALLLRNWLLSELYFDTHLIKNAVKREVLNLKLSKGYKVTCARLVHARKRKLYFEYGKSRNCVKWTRSKTVLHK